MPESLTHHAPASHLKSDSPPPGARLPTHLKRLEAESIEIMREVVAEFKNPVMLYSIGKDSSVMLHLAIKAFHPSPLPFPLLHVDTTWKFREMISFRDETARRLALDLRVHVNEDGVKRGIGPIASGSSLHTHVMKTEALKQALDKYGFDAAFGGARRDEEKSRAKERIFSFRSQEPCLGPARPAPGTVEPVQYAHQSRRINSGLSAVQLDRAGRMALYRMGEHSGRAALLRQGASGRRAQRDFDHGGR